jgi:glyoxylase-like metal-dependent hydrolase (beta-lactamase superfamily II)
MARRQEQEPARPEISELPGGVLRMELPIRLPGLGHVNCYAIPDDRGVAIVDPGLPGPGTWKVLQTRLAQAGFRMPDVHTVIVTHSHPDHFGGAARFAKETGAQIVAHRSFSFGPFPTTSEPEVSVDDLAAHHRHAHGHGDPGADPDDLLPETLQTAIDDAHAILERARSSGRTPWGGARPRPPMLTRMRWHFARFLGRSFLPVISHPVEHGDVLTLGKREWFVTHTPGHTGDHICLHDPESGVLLSGDHVLPTITPHIGGISSSPDPLASFFYSLDRVAEIHGISQVLPAHGHPFDDLPARTRAIKRHHEERLARVREISREFGIPETVQAFSQRLFRQRSWGPMAESETYAHLEHLRMAGQADRREDRDGTLRYVAG